MLGLFIVSILAGLHAVNAVQIHCNADYYWVPNKCVPLTQCLDGEYEARQPTITSDRICKQYHFCVLGKSYETAAPTASSDRTCVHAARKCLISHEYEFPAPTLTSNRACNKITPLLAGFYETQAPTFSSDRHVAPLTQCTATQHETVPPTWSSNRQCQDNTVCAGGSDYQETAPTATTDRVCVDVAIYNGDLDRASQDEINQYTDVSGYLFIFDGSSTALDLTLIRHIGGFLDIQKSNQIATISSEFLFSIGGWVFIQQNNALTSVNLPALTYIGSSLNVFDNPLLTTLSLPALQTVKDSFFICSNNAAFNVPANLPAIWSGATCAVVSGDGACISTPVACPGLH